MNKNTWYCVKHQNIQQSWYKLFVQKKKIPIETIIECLETFKEQYIIPNPSIRKTNRHTIKEASNRFGSFLEIVKTKTGIEFTERSDEYDIWYEKSSLDGSLAYNGVTDDF